MVPASLVYPRVPEIEAIARDPGLFRVFGTDNNLVPNSAIVYGLQDPRGYDGMWPARYSELLDAGVGGFPPFHRTGRMEEPKMLDLLNVKYVIAPPGTNLPAQRYTRLDTGPSSVYRNDRALPRAFLVSRYLVRDGNPARRILRDGSEDPRRVVLLERDLPAEESPDAGVEPSGSASVSHYRDTFVEVATESPRRALLVLTDAHYPGWLATVDGAPATIHRANFAFRAVSVPAGRHVVRFHYRPTSVMVGAGISLAGLAAIVCLVVFGRRVDRPNKPSRPPALPGTDAATEDSARQVHEQAAATRPSRDLTILVLADEAVASIDSGLRRDGTSLGDAFGEAARRLGLDWEVLLCAREIETGGTDGRIEPSRVRHVRVSMPGPAAAFRAGVEASAGTYILSVDSSCAGDPEVLAQLWNRRLDGGLVMAPRGGVRSGSFSTWQGLILRATGALVGRGLSLRLLDPTAGLRLYRREALKDMNVEATGPAFLVETLVRLNAEGWEIVELREAMPPPPRLPALHGCW